MNWAEQLGVLAIVLGAIALVGGIGVAVQKHRGTGSFRPPGPNPLLSTWTHGDRAWVLFKNGAAVHRGEVDYATAAGLGSSRELWEASEALGNLDALVALGMVDIEEGRRWQGVGKWRSADSQGNVAARMCLATWLHDPDGGAYAMVSDAFLGAASGRSADLAALAELASRLGHHEYATALQRISVTRTYNPRTMY